MRNPNRTTKAERRAAKQWNALAARTFGIAEAARYMRDGVLLDEATGLDRLMYAALVERYSDVMARLVEPHPRPHEKTDELAAWAKATAGTVADALTDHVLRPELERLGIDPAGYRYEYDAPPYEEVTEVRADSPELPEALRPVVEAFMQQRGAVASDYTVAYRASELDGDQAEVLILPKWERGGVLEDYARLHGTAPVIDLAAAPVGAPPFDAVHYDHQGANPHMHYPFEPHLELYRGDPNERDAARAEAFENALANDFDEDDHHA